MCPSTYRGRNAGYMKNFAVRFRLLKPQRKLLLRVNDPNQKGIVMARSTRQEDAR
jgi:hypothetical protein